MTPERNSRRKLWRLHTKRSVEHGSPILFVEGRLGHHSAGDLEVAARQHASNGVETIVIDLSGVDYLSSAALKVFRSLAEQQVQSGRRLRLRAPSVAARFALELAGLRDLIG